MIGTSLAISAFALTSLGVVEGHVARQQQQIPLQGEGRFFDRSVYRSRPEDERLGAASTRGSTPEFHLYDSFGKDTPMPGIATFAHLNWTDCFAPESDGVFDVGIVGMPFDLGVSYRPGQRFGPAAARAAAQRMAPFISYRFVIST